MTTQAPRPVTGLEYDVVADRICDLCRARLDAVAWSIGRHPNCGPYTALTDDAYDRLAAHLIHQIGVVEILDESNNPTEVTAP